MRRLHHVGIAGQCLLLHLAAQMRQAIGPGRAWRHVVAFDQQRTRRRAVLARSQVESRQVRPGLLVDGEPGQLQHRLGGRIRVRRQTHGHLHRAPFAQPLAARDHGIDGHQPGHIVALLGGQRRQAGAQAHTAQHQIHSAQRAHQIACIVDTGKPLLQAIRVQIAAGAVATAVQIKAQRHQARPGGTLGQAAKAALRAQCLVAERWHDHQATFAGALGRRVQPAEARPLGRAEPAGARGGRILRLRIRHGGVLGASHHVKRAPRSLLSASTWPRTGLPVSAWRRRRRRRHWPGAR